MFDELNPYQPPTSKSSPPADPAPRLRPVLYMMGTVTGFPVFLFLGLSTVAILRDGFGGVVWVWRNSDTTELILVLLLLFILGCVSVGCLRAARRLRAYRETH